MPRPLIPLKRKRVCTPRLGISSLWGPLLCYLPPGQEVRNLGYVCISSSKDYGIDQTAPLEHFQTSNVTSSGSTSAQKRKRSTVDDELPDRPPEEVESAKYGNFDFKEVLDEGLLKLKGAVINRAPVMTAWATIVAERLGFEREEALSIGMPQQFSYGDVLVDASSTGSECVYRDERGRKGRFDWGTRPQQR